MSMPNVPQLEPEDEKTQPDNPAPSASVFVIEVHFHELTVADYLNWNKNIVHLADLDLSNSESRTIAHHSERLTKEWFAAQLALHVTGKE